MSISITNKSSFFNLKKNISIVLRNCSVSNEIIIKSQGDFHFIFNKENNVIVGINVFDYEKYFKAKDGFASLNNEIKDYLIKNYSEFLSKDNLASFFKIGKILSKKNHPKSDKLFVLKVEFKDKERQIITNVKNVKENKNYLFAIDGATTFTGLKVFVSKVLDETSEGMILSYNSIGIDKNGLVDCSKFSIQDEYIV